jgi:hypothetical protein
MTPELAICLAVALVGAVAQWRACHWPRTPLGHANFVIARAQRRRHPDARERLHAAEWALLAIVALFFLTWGAVPIVAELVGAARARP